MPADNRRRDYAIGASPDQLRLGLFFRGTSDNVNTRVQVPRSQYYVDIVGVIRKTSGESMSMLNTGFDQALLERCVSDKHRDARSISASHLRWSLSITR